MPEAFTEDVEYALIEDEILTGYADAFYQQPFHILGIKTPDTVLYLSLAGQMISEDTRMAVYANDDSHLACVIIADIENGPEAAGVVMNYGED